MNRLARLWRDAVGSSPPLERASNSPAIPSDDACAVDSLLERYRTRIAQEAPLLSGLDSAERRSRVEALVQTWLGADGCPAGAPRETLSRLLVDDLAGWGPLEPLLDDASVAEIMVNGPHDVFVERDGVIKRTGVCFRDPEHVRTVLDRLLLGTGRRLDETSPMVDARLADGSRLNAVLPPVARDSVQITIRRPVGGRLALGDLVERGALDGPMAAFIHAAVLGRCNIVVTGGAGAGKTTLLAALCDLVPEEQRMLFLEDVGELASDHPHAVRQETRPSGPDGDREVRLADLVRNALRMRPDRLVIGEVRGGEAADMVRAMNTGHEGSMTTLHANNAHDALTRLEGMLAQGAPGQPASVLRGWIAAALDLVVHCERASDGRRWLGGIAAIEPGSTGELSATTLFRLRAPVDTGHPSDSACGEVPRRCLERMAHHGVLFPPGYFARRAA